MNEHRHPAPGSYGDALSTFLLVIKKHVADPTSQQEVAMAGLELAAATEREYLEKQKAEA